MKQSLVLLRCPFSSDETSLALDNRIKKNPQGCEQVLRLITEKTKTNMGRGGGWVNIGVLPVVSWVHSLVV